jgi:hypothetical protein
MYEVELYVDVGFERSVEWWEEVSWCVLHIHPLGSEVWMEI